MRNPVHAQHRFKNYIKAETNFGWNEKHLRWMYFSTKLDTVKSGWSIVYTSYNFRKKCYFFLWRLILSLIANSEDPDEMLQNADPDEMPHFILAFAVCKSTNLGASSLQWVQITYHLAVKEGDQDQFSQTVWRHHFELSAPSSLWLHSTSSECIQHRTDLS